MSYPAGRFRYETRRRGRDQSEVFQTIGGNALRIDTSVVTGEQIRADHLLTWAQWEELSEFYLANVESTFTVNIDGDTVSCRFVAAPQIVRKQGVDSYVVEATLGRVL